MGWRHSYRVHSVEIHTDQITPAQVLGGIANGRITANATVQRDTVAGSLWAPTASLQNLAPVGSFSTYDIAGAYSSIGFGGPALCVKPGAGFGLRVNYALWECAGPAAVTAPDTPKHKRYQITEGVLVPRTLNVDHRGDAQISYDILAAYDGTNDPVTVTDIDSVDLPSLSAANNSHRYTMHNMQTGGYNVLGKRSINLDWQGQTNTEGADSEEFDSVTTLNVLLPQLRVSGVELDWFKAAGVGGIRGQTVAPADSYFELRRRNSALTATDHMVISFQGLVNWNDVVSGDPESSATSSFNVDLHEQVGGGIPISAQVGQALAALP